LGAAIGSSFGIGDVVVADNGVVSVGLPLSGQTIGGKMSRTTHPRFQYLFNKLLKLVLPGVLIRNPLVYSTRAETLAFLKRHAAEPLLAMTHSCAASSRLTSEASHCGVCSQCLDRRVGLIAAGMQQWDVKYRKDAFLDELDEDDFMLGESYLRLMRKVARSSTETLIKDFVELADCATREDAGSPQPLERIAAMLIRQGDTVNSVVSTVGATVLDELAAGEYGPTCLIRVGLSGAPSRRKRVSAPPDLAPVGLTDAEEAEFAQGAFKMRVPIVITAEEVRANSSSLVVNGFQHSLTGADFLLLLRLVVQLFTTKDGYVPKLQLKDEHILPDDHENAISRLRGKLAPLAGGSGIIEAHRRQVRLSTHRAYVRLRRDALMHHSDARIRELTMALPMDASIDWALGHGSTRHAEPPGHVSLIQGGLGG
jgi:hypothetical protein